MIGNGTVLIENGKSLIYIFHLYPSWWEEIISGQPSVQSFVYMTLELYGVFLFFNYVPARVPILLKVAGKATGKVKERIRRKKDSRAADIR